MNELYLSERRSMTDGIIQGGRDNVLKSPEIQAEIAQIKAEIAHQYVDELAQAGRFRRWLIQRKIQKELNRRIEQIAPSRGLYLKADK